MPFSCVPFVCSGVFDFSGSALLQAGVLYSLGYNADTNSHDPPPANATWLGNGFIDITIAPVPEPATLALVCFTIPFLIRRRCHRRIIHTAA